MEERTNQLLWSGWPSQGHHMDPSMISRGDVRGGAIPVCGFNEVQGVGTNCKRKCGFSMEFFVNDR